MSDSRIKKHPILSVNKQKEFVNFTFNGKRITAKPGEMISSALFAHGIHIFGHHKKDDSPQGIFCANGQCSQCLLIVDGFLIRILSLTFGSVLRYPLILLTLLGLNTSSII